MRHHQTGLPVVKPDGGHFIIDEQPKLVAEKRQYLGHPIKISSFIASSEKINLK
jgi:hypothetical protein